MSISPDADVMYAAARQQHRGARHQAPTPMHREQLRAEAHINRHHVASASRNPILSSIRRNPAALEMLAIFLLLILAVLFGYCIGKP